MWIRKVRCHVCGGPKVTPSKTAHDHCSWCGTFTDWNHAVAYATRGSAAPGPQYRALEVYLRPEIEGAKRSGRFDQLVGAYTKLYEAHVADCPAAYSPRIADPAYRRAIVAYSAMRDAARHSDPKAIACENELGRVSRTMFYVDRPEGRFVRPDRFFAVLEAFLPLQARIDELLVASGALSVHPDAAPKPLLDKIGRSTFVQAWMPALDDETGKVALEKTGLADHYESIPDVPITHRACPTCGVDVPIAQGAHAVLCENCGTLVGAGRTARCSGCGGGFVVPNDASSIGCPYCGRVVDVARR